MVLGRWRRIMGYETEEQLEEDPNPHKYTERLNVEKTMILFPWLKPLLVALCHLCYHITVFMMINGCTDDHWDKGETDQYPDFRVMLSIGLIPKFLGFGYQNEDNWVYFKLGPFTLCFMDFHGSGRRPHFDSNGDEQRLQHHAMCPTFDPNKMHLPQPASLSIILDCYLRKGDFDEKKKEFDEDFSRLKLKHILGFLQNYHGVILKLDPRKMTTLSAKNPSQFREEAEKVRRGSV